MKLKFSISHTAALLVVLVFSLTASEIAAAAFSAGIAPSRFELRGRPGQVIRDTVVVMNAGQQPAGYRFHTADWTFGDDGGLEYIEDRLAEGSCRPWVRLERKEIQIAARGQKRYRFEIHIPEDAAPGLCKLAIMIEPAETASAAVGSDGQIRFPVVGRYAVIVYVTIGDAQPDIQFEGLGRHMMGELTLPTLLLRNVGNTHGRTFGRITATDADGQRHVLIASDFPILPGREEEIMLIPDDMENGRVDHIRMRYPLQVEGRFEVGGQRFTVEQQFD